MDCDSESSKFGNMPCWNESFIRLRLLGLGRRVLLVLTILYLPTPSLGYFAFLSFLFCSFGESMDQDKLH